MPEGWQEVKTIADATDWIQKRAEESCFLTVQLRSTNEIVGFVFLYEEPSQDKYSDLHLGYLMAEATWGKGIGSELIKGLVDWCEKAGDIKSITGGVETNNVGSIRVLEKNGFSKTTSDNPQEDMIFLKREFHLK